MAEHFYGTAWLCWKAARAQAQRHASRKIDPLNAELHQERHKRVANRFSISLLRSWDRFVMRLYKQVAPNGALNRLPYSPAFQQARQLFETRRRVSRSAPRPASVRMRRD